MNTINKLKTQTLLLLLLLLLGVSAVEAQVIEGGSGNSTVAGGIGKAEKLYKDLAYNDAIPLYESYLKKHDSTRAMCELGDCYRLTSNFERAEYWYSKAVEKGDIAPEYKLHYAKMLQANEKYEEAAKWYAAYKQSAPEDKRAGNQLKASADYGQYLLTRDRYQIKNLSFNSSGYDFAPMWFDKGLVYSSSRDSSKAIGREHTWTGTQFFDMYYVEGDKTTFGKPKQMKTDAVTKYHEAAPSFTSDSKKVYFTRNNYYNGKTKMSEDKIVKLKIFESDVDGTTWKNDKPFPYNNDEYSVGHPALTPDGNTMYFISDMPGGFGGTDVYVSNKEGESWSTPKNLGEQINTEGMEMFPYVDEDGVLYFASDGQGGLGGLDIFKVKQDIKTKQFGKIRNIGAPINSSYDDFSLVYGPDKSTGYFTSNRPEGKGLDDIYSFEDDGIYLEGIVVDAQTGLPICNSKVVMKAKLTKSEEGRSSTECDGEFEFGVIKNMDYCFEASAEGYGSNDKVCATTKGVKPGETVFVKIPLDKSKEYAMSVQVLGKSLKSLQNKSIDSKSPTTPKSVEDKSIDSKSPTTPKSVESVEDLKPLSKAKILLSSKCEGWTKALETDENGKICEIVRCDCDYIIVANAQGYLPGYTEVVKDDGDCKIDRKCGVNPKEAEVVLDPIPGMPTGDFVYNPETGKWENPKTGEVVDAPGIELKDIYYDFDKWYIREESERELNKLLGFLQENSDAVVEIGSHTDARAPYDYNIKLSQRRAQSVVDWLIARGINRTRLKPKGYGETQPRNACVDGVTCTEYEHQRNRRTEFKVIGGKINVKSLERFDMQVDPCKQCPF
jgi:outer membrane protein OmpA-like peptidoglycan-associated protein/tetratricopeptide (TPR) repeat protein